MAVIHRHSSFVGLAPVDENMNGPDQMISNIIADSPSFLND